MSIDSVWEQKYSQGHSQLYPWDSVVSFVFRNLSDAIPRSEISILEIGFGTGSNLWFAAREGFSVCGIEGSQSAVSFAQGRFKRDALHGQLIHGDFTSLPFPSNYFDLVIDRCSLTCVGLSEQNLAISEVHRCLKSNGKFFHNTYADTHTSMLSGTLGDDQLVTDINRGTLVNTGRIHFSSLTEITTKFSDGWTLLDLQRRETTYLLDATQQFGIHSEWIVTAQKVVDS